MEAFRFGIDYGTDDFLKLLENGEVEIYNVHGKKSVYGFGDKKKPSIWEDAELLNASKIKGVWHHNGEKTEFEWLDWIVTKNGQIIKIIKDDQVRNIIFKSIEAKV